MTRLIVACDGSCLVNPGGPTGWAWAAEDGSSACGGIESGTNNIGELNAVLNLLQDFRDTPVLAQIDSQYAMNATVKWVAGWKRKGWRTASGQPVKNLELVQQIHAEMQARRQRGVPIEFEWVKGHNDHPLNTVADELAGQASGRAAAGNCATVRTPAS